MPRVRIKKKEYAITDFRKWLRSEMAAQEVSQTDIAGWLGISQPAVSKKIKNMEFDVKEMMVIFSNLKTTEEQAGKLFIY